jgi:hypothetical protein
MLAACPTGNEKPGDGDALVVKTGSVTFFNESGYRAEVHLDAFSGPLLVELGSGGMKTVDVRVSDNHGIGTMFSIAYLYRINDGFDADSGDIFAELIDPDVQINRVIEENKSITIQIPHPKNPEFRSAFVKILNAHNMPIELRHLSQVLKQTGNGLVPVPPGKTGVYRLEGIGDGGKQIENHLVFSNFVGTDVPTFTAKNSTVYEFSYNGTSVTKTGEWTIVFN